MRQIQLLSIVLIALSLLASCEQKDCCSPPPIESQFEGKWELVKVTNGFAQIELVGDEIGYTETIEFNAYSSTFERKRNGKRELFSKFSIGKEFDQNAIILKDDNSYQWYTFLEENDEETLSLYQKATLGAVLADGSDHEYKKVVE